MLAKVEKKNHSQAAREIKSKKYNNERIIERYKFSRKKERKEKTPAGLEKTEFEAKTFFFYEWANSKKKKRVDKKKLKAPPPARTSN
jgi:hypothetical protein